MIHQADGTTYPVGIAILRIKPNRLFAIRQRMVGVALPEKQQHGPHLIVVRLNGNPANCIAKPRGRILQRHDLGGIYPSARADFGRQEKRGSLTLTMR